MGAVAIRQGGRHGVAVAASRPTDALQEAGLVGGHRTEQHRGQVADIDAHLQRGRSREQVLEPGPGVLVLEAVFQFLAHLSLQQAGVLGGNHPAQVTLAEALRPPVGSDGIEEFIVGLDRVQAGHAQQVFRVLPRHRQLALATWRGHERHLGIEHQGQRTDAQCVPLMMLGALQDSRFQQGIDGGCVQVERHACREQSLLPQGGGCPAVIPGRAAVAG